MKRIFLLTSLLFSLSFNYLSAQSPNSSWSAHKTRKWFKKKNWLNGLSIIPHSSIDHVQFARQYHLNQAAWEKAFAYLKNTDLKTLVNGRHVIDGDNVYAIVSEAPTKDYDKTTFESHQKYIDLQYVITGEENMAKAPLISVQSASLTMNRPILRIIQARGKFTPCLRERLCFSFQQRPTARTSVQAETKW